MSVEIFGLNTAPKWKRYPVLISESRLAKPNSSQKFSQMQEDQTSFRSNHQQKCLVNRIIETVNNLNQFPKQPKYTLNRPDFGVVIIGL